MNGGAESEDRPRRGQARVAGPGASAFAGRAAVAEPGVGWIADTFGRGGVFGTMIVCCVLTMVFSAMTLGQRPR